MRTLIVHADDFNLTEGVCRGIIEGFRDGVVRSTSVMANLPGLSEAAAMLNTHRGLDTGLHFNLTLGRPMSPPETVPSLVNDKGDFRKRAQLNAPDLSTDDIRRELLAQIGALQALGVKVSHVDTHHHIHENEKIAGVIEEVVSSMGLAMRSYGQAMFDAAARRGIPSPHHLITRFYGDQDVTTATLLEIIRDLPAGVSELCCHPAQVDDRLRAISSYSDPRQRELQILCSTEVRQALEEAHVRVASYADAFA